MQSDILDPVPADAPLAALTACLGDPVDAVRAAAAQALGALGTAKVAPALVDALLDEDPDVRVDAMTALARLARPEDAPALRRSLAGDPEGAVKVAAIRALARLADTEAVPLLRRLARERADDIVAWDESGDVWDEWLDVQIAAIEALGRMGASEAVDDLLAARADEFGQDLDEPVFAALAAIPGAGPAALLDFLRDGDARARRRAAAAVARLAPEQLRPLTDALLADREGAVRALAIPALSPDEDAATGLCRSDPDPEVRRAALAAFTRHRPDLAQAALSDPDDACRAVAIRALPAPATPRGRDDLRANLTAWINAGEPAEALAALDRLAGDSTSPETLTVIAACAENPEHRMELRLAALRHLAGIGDHGILAPLGRAAVDRARQIRMAALVALAECAATTPPPLADEAAALLAAAISGTLLPPQPERHDESPPGPRPPSPGEIRITPEGRIVPATPDDTARAHRSSTLAALTPEADLPADDGDARAPEDDPPHGGDAAVRRPRAGGRRRVPVDGPDDVVADLRLNALRAAATCPHAAVGTAIIGATGAGRPDTRRAAFEALEAQARANPLPDDAVAALSAGLADPEPAIRLPAARAIAAGLSPARAAGMLRAVIEDPSAPVRAAALMAVGGIEPDRLIEALGAREKPVREAVLDTLLSRTDPAMLARGLDRALEAGSEDILARLARTDSAARAHLLAVIHGQHAPAGTRLSALRALAAVAP